MAGFEVSGRRFRTEADYKAALRDQAKIDKIKTQVNMEQPGEVITLYDEIGAGTYRFETVIGNDFDDEIYELAQNYKRQGYDKDSRLPDGKKKKNRTGQTRKALKDSGKKGVKKEKVSLNEFDKEMQKEILHELKKREKRRKLTVLMCSLVAVLCFGYFGIYYFFSGRAQAQYENLVQLKGDSRLAGTLFREVHHSEDEVIELEILEEYQTLYHKNKKLIGWLKIDDTIIDYPVMQTSNNEYYLDHNFNQEKDNNGSIFMDKDCVAYPRSQNLILYGHHMRSGKMFGDLEKYSSESYYKKHSIIQFDTIYEKGTYQVMYVFRAKVLKENEIAFKYYQFIDANSAEEFDSYMREMKEMSLYDTGVSAQYGEELLTLSTCDHSQTDGRFVVVAKRVQ